MEQWCREVTDCLDLMVQMRDYYGALIGMLFLQVCAHILAYHAMNHSKFHMRLWLTMFLLFIDIGLEIFVRTFFIVIQLIFLLIFEKRLHMFQYRTLIVLACNAWLIVFRTEANPLLTFLLLYVVSSEMYLRASRPYAKEIDEALDEDLRLDLSNMSDARRRAIRRQQRDAPRE